jgi:hypothetical protein
MTTSSQTIREQYNAAFDALPAYRQMRELHSIMKRLLKPATTRTRRAKKVGAA